MKELWEGICAVPSSQPSQPLSAWQVSVMSYSAKFASCFYGPFRWVCPSARCARPAESAFPELLGPGPHLGPHWSLCSTLLLLRAKRRQMHLAQQRLAGGKVTEG